MDIPSLYVGIGGPPTNSQAGGQGSLTMSVQLENLNLDYTSENKQALMTLGLGAILMGAGAFTGKAGIFAVGFIVALFGWARYQAAQKILQQRDALAAQFVAGAAVKV